MKSSTLLWCSLLLAIVLLMLLEGNTVNAWNRQIFNRYSRNLLRRNGLASVNVEPGNGGVSIDGFTGGIGSEFVNGNNNNNNGYDEFRTLFGLGVNAMRAGQQQALPPAETEPEVYGIVEPLIEDTPCADRACIINEDCCPTGVCVNTYGEGRCVYIFGHNNRELCHRDTDCEANSACVRDINGLWLCQKNPSFNVALHKVDEFTPFNNECFSSSDCNVAKGLCCQLQRSHRNHLPKKMCTYFQDPFVCIDITPPATNVNDEDMRGTHLLSSFNKRQRM